MRENNINVEFQDVNIGGYIFTKNGHGKLMVKTNEYFENCEIVERDGKKYIKIKSKEIELKISILRGGELENFQGNGHHGTATTDKGTQYPEGGFYKDRNEDRIVIDNKNGVYAVIDGMGGGKGGDIAAEMLANGINNNPLNIRETFNKTQKEMQEKGKIGLELDESSGACFSYVRINGKEMEYAQVGDTYIVVYDSYGKVKWKSEPESEVGDLIKKGKLTEEQGLYYSENYIVSNSIGAKTKYPGELTQTGKVKLKSGDRVLLASDGITDNYTTDQIGKMIVGLDSKQATEKMFSSGQNEKIDNRSIVVIDIK